MILPPTIEDWNKYYNFHKNKTEITHLGKIEFSIPIKDRTKKKGIFNNFLKFFRKFTKGELDE